MKVVVQNLQKKPGLASELVGLRDPDVFLAQEIDLPSEDAAFPAHHTSRTGYGTAIHCGGGFALTDVRRVTSPWAEVGGLVRKKTTVATLVVSSADDAKAGTDGIEGHDDDAASRSDAAARVELVSFHGYNGQPFKSVPRLVEHVRAVLSVVDPDLPAVFAGDFNTWTEAHAEGARDVLERGGFRLAFSWPYPGRDVPLDRAFVRGLRLREGGAAVFESASDHRGAALELDVLPE